MSGRHLILPHSHHHVHHRSTDNELLPDTQLAWKLCNTSRSMDPKELVRKLKDALIACDVTRAAMEESFKNWLLGVHNATEHSMRDMYKLHHLRLAHPFREDIDAHNADLVAQRTGTFESEIPKIINTLHILHAVLGSFKKHNSSETLDLAHEKIEHNKVVAESFGVCQDVFANSYNGNHAELQYAFLQEVVDVMRILNIKYKKLLDEAERQAEYVLNQEQQQQQQHEHGR